MKHYAILKRGFDIVASLAAIIVFLIPWILIGIIINIQSPGPIVYKARRIGLNGKAFTLYKFRSMCVESGNVHTTTLRSDPRIFPFGKMLRKTKLDETLQLINILKGEMSIIGPRPEDEENSSIFYVGKYRDILSVKPGLSSPASLFDYTHGELYSDEEKYIKEFLPQKLDLELFYVHHRTLLYDFSLIIRTVVTIFEVIAGKKKFSYPKELKQCDNTDEKKGQCI